MVAGGGPMARLPQLIGRSRALEVLLSSDDISADHAEAYGYVKGQTHGSARDSHGFGHREPPAQRNHAPKS
jgi:enoyl-CoA hydratase/carnithine racemase